MAGAEGPDGGCWFMCRALSGWTPTPVGATADVGEFRLLLSYWPRRGREYAGPVGG